MTKEEEKINIHKVGDETLIIGEGCLSYTKNVKGKSIEEIEKDMKALESLLNFNCLFDSESENIHCISRLG